jgi:hypothetical protein
VLHIIFMNFINLYLLFVPCTAIVAVSPHFPKEVIRVALQDVHDLVMNDAGHPRAVDDTTAGILIQVILIMS